MKPLGHFLLLLIALLMINYSLTAKPRNRTLVFKVNKSIVLEYKGSVDSKIPMGSGVLYVRKDGRIVDMIEGIFNNFEVSNATLLFSITTIGEYYRYIVGFNGSLSFDYSESEIKYTLIDGSFINNKNLADGSTIIPVKDFIVTRDWEKLLLTPEEFKFVLLYKPQGFPFNETKKELILDIAGMLPEVIECREYSLNLRSNTLKGPYLNNGKKGLLEFDGNVTGHYSTDYLAIHCNNGDSLYIKENKIDMLRHVDKGTIEYHEDDVQEILKQMPLEYKSMLDSLYYIGIKDRLSELYYQDLIPWEDALDNTGSYAVEVTYPNGDKYTGSLYRPRDVNSSRSYLLKLTRLPKEEEYYWGLYSTRQGEKRFYINGFSADTLRIKFDKLVEEKRIAEEKEMQEYLASREAIEKEFYERKTQLEKKYGKKYVDPIYDNNDIQIGTPKALLEEYYQLFANRKTRVQTAYDVYWVGVFIRTVWVDNSTLKVVKVGY